MTPSEKAQAAKDELNSPILKAAFIDMRESYVLRLESLDSNDYHAEHELCNLLRNLRGLKTQLQKYMQDQSVENHRLRQDEYLEKARESLRLATSTSRK